MRQTGDPAFIRLNGIRPDPAALKLLAEPTARERLVLPLRLEQNKLVVATVDANDDRNLRAVQAACLRPVRPLQVSYSELQDAYDRVYQKGPETTEADQPDLITILRFLGHLDEESAERVQAAVGLAKVDSVAVAQACRKLGVVDDEGLAEGLALMYGLPHLHSSGPEPSLDLAPLIPVEQAQNNGVLPLWWLDGTLMVGVTSAESLECLTELRQMIGAPVRVVVCPESLWNSYYRRIYLTQPEQPAAYEEDAVQWLVRRDQLTVRDVQTARSAAQQTGQALPQVLIQTRLIDAETWLQALSQASGLPMGNRTSHPAPSEEMASAGIRIPAAIARRLGFAPLALQGDNITIAVAHPNPRLEKTVAALTRRTVKPVLVSSEHLKRLQDDLAASDRNEWLEAMPRLGELLVRMKIIRRKQLEQVLDDDKSLHKPLGGRLVGAGLLDEYDLAQALSLQTGLPTVRLDHVRLDPDALDEIPSDLSCNHQILPLWANASELWVAVSDPLDYRGMAAAELASGKRIRPVIAPGSVLRAACDRVNGRVTERAIPPEAMSLVNRLIEMRYLNQVEAAEALRLYSENGLPMDEALIHVSPAWDVEMVRAMAGILKVPFHSLELEEHPITTIDPLGKVIERNEVKDPVERGAALLLDLETARRFSALPVDFQGDRLRVAFANPLFEPALKELQTRLQRPIAPVLALRQDLDAAIQRHLGRRNLGTHLLMAGALTRSQVNDALDYAHRTGVRLGHALVSRGYVTWEQIYRSLSEQTGLPLYDLRTVEIDTKLASTVNPRLAREHGFLPIRREGEQVITAIVDPLDERALELAAETVDGPVTPVLVTENDLESALEKLFSENYLNQSISELLERAPDDSAYHVLSRGQIIVLVATLVISAVWLFFDYISFLIVLNAIFTVFYLSFSIYKLYLIYRALSHDLEVPITPQDLNALDESTLPVYTILIPVYHEAMVLVELLNALKNLDYPHTKLDIKILMEADDLETIQAFKDWNGPSHFHGVIVPYGQPKTKPKACNYGLLHARGDYVVIFDAEDVPDRDQLKKIVAAFKKVRPEVVCIQSKLNYYNRDQNLLTRWFTVEYSMWFDLFLPGLDASGAPIPLGGTSNHFRREALIEVGAWDPYNVTEDADLGVRLYKRGYKTAIIDSTTYEEANSQIYNWIRQRSRWIKGYIQTWLVHMRHPVKLMNEIGPKAFLAFQFVVGGTFFAALLNPIYWLLTTLWFLVEWSLIQKIFPGWVFYFGGLCLFVGNFAFTYMNVAGAMRRRYYGMVKYALLTPLYWGLTSIGAWKGFWQLLTKPHFWEKTHHGLFEGEPTLETGETTAPSFSKNGK